MDLAAWMKLNGFVDQDVADLLAIVGRSAVTRWRLGHRVPSVASMRRLAEVSGGAVSPNDWVDFGPRVVAPHPSRTARAAPKGPATDDVAEEPPRRFHRDSL
jgi:hypothetical protein